MQLQFKPRAGDPHNWSRVLVVKDDRGDLHAFTLVMQTSREERPGKGTVSVRRGKVFRTQIGPSGNFTADPGALLWEGELPAGPPPGRAFALAAGLCDENGESAHLPLPAWASAE